MIFKLALLLGGALAVGQTGDNFVAQDPNVDYSIVQKAQASNQAQSPDPNLVAVSIKKKIASAINSVPKPQDTKKKNPVEIEPTQLAKAK